MADLIAELEGVVEQLPAQWEAEAYGGRFAMFTHFLRTHHAEIAAAVRDSQRIDFLQREVDEIGAFLLHNGKGVGSGFTGLGLRNTNRTLRRAIDQCLDVDAALAQEGAG